MLVKLFMYQQRLMDGRISARAWAIIKNNKDHSYLPPLQPHIGPYSSLINTKFHITVFSLTYQSIWLQLLKP